MAERASAGAHGFIVLLGICGLLLTAAVVEEPVDAAVDAAVERWLRDLWSRRGMPFPELNLKQAWLIPSATAIPNPNGTAPGWWVDVKGGRVIVALPGPPREMRPMLAEPSSPMKVQSAPPLVER